MNETVPLDLLTVALDPVITLKDKHNSSARESWVYQPRVYKSLEVFVADRVGDRGPCTSDPKLPGDPYRFRFSDGFCVSLRITCPEPSDPDVIKVEKITRVVEWMRYLSANTSIPTPHILSFSRDVSDVLPILGVPFYLVETMRRGRSLRSYLTALRESETVSASRANEIRSNIYQQISQYYLELRRLTMYRIGSVSSDSSGKWEVTKRPFTDSMEYLLSDIPNCPTHEWPEEPFSTVEDYFWFMSEQNMTALWGLRSLGIPRRLDPVSGDVFAQWEDEEFNLDPEKVAKCARLRFRARHGFLQLINELATREEYSNGPFVPAMPHLDWELFRVDYDQRTKKINYLFEPTTTNFMPLPFLCIPPPWLTLKPVMSYVDRNKFNSFIEQYETELPMFLEAMRTVERRLADTNTILENEEPLSTLMLESWENKRFWFHYALENIQAVDQLYYAVLYQLHPEGKPFELSPALGVEMEKYVEHSMEQIYACRKDYDDFLKEVKD
ncbi:unnamed protein product [Clonostachys chloroleuca]|uniref:Aminoglycoside phosphotransferase domain-containing protein n=1 Tax=Clonostachys chloroleuca TaxID=1926264 RepID=A0AA35MBI5_9HYPO|nr:unnamed protein product [Clonostachys chloroleuca]